MALNSLIGIELHTATEIDSVIPPVVIPDEIKQSDVSDRPELKIAYDQIRIAESSLKLADSKYKPQLYIGIDILHPVMTFAPILILTMPCMRNCLFHFLNGENVKMRNVLLPTVSVWRKII